MAFPPNRGLSSRMPTSLTALQRKREEEAQARPNAQASAAVAQPSRIRLKDIEVSRGCDLSCTPVFWKAGNFGRERQVQPPCSWECMVCLPAWQVSDGVAVEWLSLLSRSAES